MSFVRKAILKVMLHFLQGTAKKISKIQMVERLTDSELDKVQNQQLSKLITYAKNNVPYYSQILEIDGIIGENGTVDRRKFEEVPLLDKTIIRKYISDLKAENLQDGSYYYNTSGGSTGESVRFIQSLDYLGWNRAGKVFFDKWTGCDLGCKKAVLWGSERDVLVGNETLKFKIKRLLKNELFLNAFLMSDSDEKEYIKNINSFSPTQILAYAGSIFELAKYIEKSGSNIYSPKSIMVSAETLYPHMREQVEKVFRSPIFNRYGSREVGDIACECDHHSGLHVNPLTHYVEILDTNLCPTEPGEVGEVVVTSLINLAMPLIRYRIGDIAVWSEKICPCGRNWPLLKEVKGRVSDTFVTSSGAQVYGEYFTHLFYFVDWVNKFQVIQDKVDSIVIKLELSDKVNRAIEKSPEIDELKRKINIVMGDTCKIEFQFVDNLPLPISGKHRYTISNLKE